jgi:hypothetical protein
MGFYVGTMLSCNSVYSHRLDAGHRSVQERNTRDSSSDFETLQFGNLVWFLALSTLFLRLANDVSQPIQGEEGGIPRRQGLVDRK